MTNSYNFTEKTTRPPLERQTLACNNQRVCVRVKLCLCVWKKTLYGTKCFISTIYLEIMPPSFREYAPHPKIVCLALYWWNVRLFQFVTVIERCWIWSSGRSISFETICRSSEKQHQCDCICALSNVCLRAMLKNVWSHLARIVEMLRSFCVRTDCLHLSFIRVFSHLEFCVQ